MPALRLPPSGGTGRQTAQTALNDLTERLAQIHTNWTEALLVNLCQKTVQDNVALMSAEQQALVQRFLDAGALPTPVSYDFVQTVKEALTDLERIAIPPEDILLAPTAVACCTVQELLTRFPSTLMDRSPTRINKVRIVVEW